MENGTQMELIELIYTDRGPSDKIRKISPISSICVLFMRQPSRASIWAALIAVYIIWGSTYLAIRFVVETMPPFLSAGVRFVIAGGVLFAFRRVRGDPAPLRVEWRSAAIVGLLLLTLGNGGVVWAEQHIASGLVALMIGTTPLWIVLIDYLRPWRLWGGESRFARPRPRALLGVVTGFVGVVFLVTAGGPVTGSINPAAAAAVIFATFAWAVGSLYGRGAKLPASPLLGTGMEMLIGGVGLLVAGTLTGEWARLDPATFTTRSVVALLYLIVVGSWGGFGSYVWLLRNAPTPLVSTYAYVNPLVALFLGALLAGETITPQVLIAAAIIVGAVVLTTSSRAPKSD